MMIILYYNVVFYDREIPENRLVEIKYYYIMFFHLIWIKKTFNTMM